MLVVLGHSIQEYMGEEGIVFFLIYSIHMPLFFFLSGVVTKKGNTCYYDVILRKIKRLFPPYLLFCGLLLIAHLAQDILLNKNFFASLNKEIIMDTILMNYQSMFANLWFLPALFVASILHSILINTIQSNRIRMLLCILIATLISFFRLASRMAFPLHLDAALLAMLFLELGYSYKNRNAGELKITQRTVFCLNIVLYVVAVIAQVAGASNSFAFYRADADYPILALASAVSGTYIIVMTFEYVMTRTIGKKSIFMLLSNLGKSSLYIYGFHFVIQNIVQVIMGKLILSKIGFEIPDVIIVIVCGVLTLVISAFSARIYENATSRLRKGIRGHI